MYTSIRAKDLNVGKANISVLLLIQIVKLKCILSSINVKLFFMH